MRVYVVSLSLLILGFAMSSQARFQPSSGRHLQRGHWLGCESAGAAAYRQSNFFTRTTEIEKSQADVPSFSGSYEYEVRDYWKEWVTKSGSSCSHCGETCTTSGSGKNARRTCTCNSCSWQELETFSRPWSTQKTNWSARWTPDTDYQAKRREWMSAGSPSVTRDKDHLEQLLNFDPDRPQKYYLFPGETEELQVSNDSGKEISPSISVTPSSARHEYSYVTVVNGVRGNRPCDDVDLNIETVVNTGKRKVTDPPNSIQLKDNWVEAPRDSAGMVSDEPTRFRFVDISSMFYDGQNMLDHYKSNKVQIRLRQIDRYLWFDRFVSGTMQIRDNVSFMKYHNTRTELPPFAEFVVKASDLFKTPMWGTEFHLEPGKTYELCTQMHRANNVYYRAKGFFGGEVWSDWNCGVFKFSDKATDRRRFVRKFRDAWTRGFPLPIIWW